MLFKIRTKSFGLDISQQILRLIQLKKYKNRAKIISYGEINVPSGVIKNGKIVKVDDFSKLIKELIKKCKGQKISTRYVTTCLPEPNTFIKQINITYPESKNILEEIINESKKHIPYPLENTYLDWQYVNERDKTKILICVCPKDIVDNYLDSLNKSGLLPITLEVEAASICRSIIPFNKPDPNPIMILDMGATRTSLIVYQSNTILFSISLSFSSNTIDDLLTNKLKLSNAEARKVKNYCGLDPQKAKGGSKRILQPLVDDLARQIREAKYFYHEHFSKDSEITKLILTGGGSHILNLTNYLEEKCKIKTETANPTINLIDSEFEFLKESNQSYGTAIGLALRNIQKD